MEGNLISKITLSLLSINIADALNMVMFSRALDII